jgi:hypothetical protein
MPQRRSRFVAVFYLGLCFRIGWTISAALDPKAANLMPRGRPTTHAAFFGAP